MWLERLHRVACEQPGSPLADGDVPSPAQSTARPGEPARRLAAEAPCYTLRDLLQADREREEGDVFVYPYNLGWRKNAKQVGKQE